jgi:hypothetical protein
MPAASALCTKDETQALDADELPEKMFTPHQSGAVVALAVSQDFQSSRSCEASQLKSKTAATVWTSWGSRRNAATIASHAATYAARGYEFHWPLNSYPTRMYAGRPSSFSPETSSAICTAYAPSPTPASASPLGRARPTCGRT